MRFTIHLKKLAVALAFFKVVCYLKRYFNSFKFILVYDTVSIHVLACLREIPCFFYFCLFFEILEIFQKCK